jgi:hypothetical protein
LLEAFFLAEACDGAKAGVESVEDSEDDDSEAELTEDEGSEELEDEELGGSCGA